MAARLGALALLVVLGCARVPYTNRSQLILVSPTDETVFGAQAFQQVVPKSRLDPSPGTNRAVQEVGQGTGCRREPPGLSMELRRDRRPRQVKRVLRPGWRGRGLHRHPRCRADQAGLVVVFGHEIARALASHGAERMSQGKLAQLGALRSRSVSAAA